jgi:hypothetical protein
LYRNLPEASLLIDNATGILFRSMAAIETAATRNDRRNKKERETRPPVPD